KHLALLNPRKSGYDGDTEQLCSFVPMEKLKTGVVQLDEERPIGEVIGGYTYFEDGDVLQAKVTPCFENKNIAIAKGLTNGIGFGSSEINVLRTYQGVNAEYLYYRVQEDSYMGFCTSSMIGAGGLKRVPTDVINNFKVATPEVFEQTQIARFLDHETARIDALIEEQQRLIELLKEKRQAVISHVVTKGLDPTVPMKDSGVEWLGEVPAHWVVSKFGYISSVVRGGSPRPAGDPELFNGDYSPWVTVAEITKDDEIYLDETETFLTKKGSDQCRVFSKGTLLLSNSGATLGVPKILMIDANANDGVVGFENISLDKEYSYLYLATLTEGLRDRAAGSGQPNLNTDIVKSIDVPIPPSNEVTEIVAAVKKLRAQFNFLSKEAVEGIKLLQERRSALISAAVTGKIDVRGWQPQSSAPIPELAQEAV
ncbi:restriction endonuclease subunit S, partial [Stutzerimonas kunmingensis]